MLCQTIQKNYRTLLPLILFAGTLPWAPQVGWGFLQSVAPPVEQAQTSEQLVTLGRESISQDDFDTAIELLSEAIGQDATLASAYLERGLAWFRKNDLQQALVDLNQAIHLDLQPSIAYLNRGMVLSLLGRFPESLLDYEQALRLDPDQSEILDRAAWLLATCPDSRYRDGKRAVTLARKACHLTNWSNATHLDSLAAACAEIGDFSNAIKWQTKATELQSSDPTLRERLRLYLSRRPYRANDELVRGWLVHAKGNIPVMEELLIGERESAKRRISRLQVMANDYDQAISDVNNPLSVMIDIGRHQASIGEVEIGCQTLRHALEFTDRLNDDATTYKAIAIQEISYHLARHADFGPALLAATKLTPDLDFGGLFFTSRGMVTVPDGAKRANSLLQVAVARAAHGDVEGALAIADDIALPSIRAAAHWRIVFSLAHSGHTEAAEQMAATARLFKTSPEAMSQDDVVREVIEFNDAYPNAVSMEEVVDAAYGRLAVAQLTAGHEQNALKTVELIGNDDFQNIVLTRMSLERAEKSDWESSARIAKSISNEGFHDLAFYQLAMAQLAAEHWSGFEVTVGKIISPSGQSRARQEAAIRSVEANHLGNAKSQVVEQHRTARMIETGWMRSVALVDAARLLHRVNDHSGAVEALLEAKTAADETDDTVSKARLLSQIASGFATAKMHQEASSAYNESIRMANQLDEFEQSEVMLSVVRARLENNASEAAFECAKSIPDKTHRAEALVDLGKHFAKLDQLEACRSVFFEAFLTAMQTDKIMGSESSYSKAGTIQNVAAEYCSVDIPGLVGYLEKSESPYIKTYGYLGASTQLIPEEFPRDDPWTTYWDNEFISAAP